MRLKGSLPGRVLRYTGNRLARRSFGTEALSVDAVPIGAVVVFFAGAPEEIYQVEQWQPVLDVVAEERPVVVLVTAPDVGRLVAERTGLDVVFSRGGADVERLVEHRAPAAMLYLNHRPKNFPVLRHPGVVHVYLGHGESDKGSSASHQNMAYDYCFVAGQAARDRLATAMPLFDVAVRAPMVGRPNLDPEVLRRVGAQAPIAPAPGRSTVLYMPTWEGGLPSMAFGSVASHGEGIVTSVLADPTLRLIYRPHPLTGTKSATHARADQRIRRLIAGAGLPHQLDTAAYGVAFAHAEIAIVDISSVAYDWIATGRPMVVTVPADERARPTPGRLYEVAPALSREDAGRTAALVRELLQQPVEGWADLVDQHVGDTTPGASLGRFLAALDAVARRRPASVQGQGGEHPVGAPAEPQQLGELGEQGRVRGAGREPEVIDGDV